MITDNITNEIRYEYMEIPDHCTVNSVFNFNAKSMKFEGFQGKFWYFLYIFAQCLWFCYNYVANMFWINFPASEPAESNYYLDGINERQPELAKKFKPRDRRGRKAKLINFEVPPEVCHEVELVATENVPINENAEEDFEGPRPKRAASN